MGQRDGAAGGSSSLVRRPVQLHGADRDHDDEPPDRCVHPDRGAVWGVLDPGPVPGVREQDRNGRRPDARAPDGLAAAAPAPATVLPTGPPGPAWVTLALCVAIGVAVGAPGIGSVLLVLRRRRR